MEQKCFKLGEILYRSSDATCDYELLITKPKNTRKLVEDILSKIKKKLDEGAADQDVA